jgi:heme exporter protein B
VTHVLTILRKDLQLELRTKEVTSGLLVLVVLIVLVFTFALEPRGAAEAAPAVLWVTAIFAGMLAVQRVFLVERENGCWYGLLASPTDRGAIFVAKMGANLVLLAAAQVVLVALLLVLLGVEPPAAPLAFAAVNALGLIGFAALATLFAAISVRLRARELLLPLLVLPLLVPLVICAVEATRVILDGGDAGRAGVWLRVLGAFDVIFTAAGFLLFEQLVEE